MAKEVAPWLAGLDDAWEVPCKTQSQQSSIENCEILPRNDSIMRKPLHAEPALLDSQPSSIRRSGSTPRNPLAPLNSNQANSLREQCSSVKRPTTRSVSELSNGSIVHYDTVQQRSKSTSPTKKQETLEWKRRLIMGKVGYGDQTDLFGAGGLENIFAPSKGSNNKKPLARGQMNWMFQKEEQTNSSSPPPQQLTEALKVPKDRAGKNPEVAFDSEPRQDGLDHEEVNQDQRDTVKSHVFKAFARDQNKHNKPKALSVPVAHQSPRVPSPSQSDTSDTRQHTLGDTAVGNRTVSGQTDLESFSPVFVSKQTSTDGCINYAALDSRTIKQIRSLDLASSGRKEQHSQGASVARSVAEPDISTFSDGPSVNDSQPVEPDFSLSENLPTGTPPAVGILRHLEVERGVRSSAGSSRQKPSSPQENSKKSSLPLRLPDQRAPPQTTNITQNPTTPIRHSSSKDDKAASSGSPLKLFGAHDTFTNNRLLRRISQLDPEIQDRSGTKDPHAFVSKRSSSIQNSFGSGDLTQHGFDAQITVTDASGEFALDSHGSPDSSVLPPGTRIPPGLEPCRSSNMIDGSNLKRKLSRHSAKTSFGSEIDTSQSKIKPHNPTIDDVTDVDLQQNRGQNLGFQVTECKRPPTSPFKNPTPKRRRTLHAVEHDVKPDERSISTASRRDPITRKHKDVRQDQTNKNPRLLSKGKLVRPRNPTPSQRRASKMEEDINYAAETFASHHPERLQELMDELDASVTSGDSSGEDMQLQAATIATEVAEFTIRVTQASGDFGERKRSINTQDFTAEAVRVMNALRAKHGQLSGLSSVEESHQESDLKSLLEESQSTTSHESSIGSSSLHSVEQGSTPHTINGVRVSSHLRRFEETEETQYMPDSEASLHVDQKSDCEHPEVIEDEYSNIRITKPSGERFHDTTNPDSPQALTQRTVSSKRSDLFTNKTQRSGSTRRSDNLGTLAPDAVEHLIGPAMGQMSFDTERGCWVKAKSPRKQASMFLEPPSQLSTSDDDPLREISDLPVDEQLERRRISSPAKSDSGDVPCERDLELEPAQSSEDLCTKQSFATGKVDAVHSRPVTRDSNHMTEVFHQMHSSSIPSRQTGWGSSQLEGVETRATSWRTEELRSLRPMDKSTQKRHTQERHAPVGAEGRCNDVLAGIPESPSQVSQHGTSARFPLPPTYLNNRAMAERSAPQQQASPTTVEVEDDSTIEIELSAQQSFTDLDDEDLTVADLPALKLRATPHNAFLGSSLLARGSERQVSLRRQTLTNRFAGGHTTHEPSEVSFVAPLPGERMMSVSLSVSKPITPRTRGLDQIREPESSPIKADLNATFILSDLPEFTVHQQEDFERPSENLLARRLVQHAEQARSDRYALARSHIVKTLTDEHQSEPYWEDLKHLDLQSRSLSALIGLDEFCSGVRDLDVSDNNLMDLEGAPSSIRRLTARSNALDNLTSWTHLKNLQHLDVSGNNIDHLDSLSCLFHLRELNLSDNEISDMTGLCELEGLLKLTLSGNRIEIPDFEGFNCAQLQELDLSGNLISKIKNLELLPKLKVLKLNGNVNLGAFAASEPMCHLEELSLQGCGLKTLDVTHFPALRKLNLDDNSLEAVTGLEKLKHLDFLSLRSQTLAEGRKIAIFDQLFDARTVRLSYNTLSSIALPRPVLSIQQLELASVGLQELPANFGRCLPNLRSVDLGFNFLKDLRPLVGIQNLEHLVVSGNRIDRLRKTVALLGQLGDSLRSVDLRDNPVTQSLYPHSMFETCKENALISRGTDSSFDTLSLPPRDIVQDRKYQERLDDETKLKRRVYEIMVAHGCPGLAQLDGMTFVKDTCLAKDWIWERLVHLRIVRRSAGSESTKVIDC